MVVYGSMDRLLHRNVVDLTTFQASIIIRIFTLIEALSWECRRNVADMSARHSDVGGLRQKRHVAAIQDRKKKPRHTQFMSITDDKFKSAQTYELATLP